MGNLPQVTLGSVVAGLPEQLVILGPSKSDRNWRFYFSKSDEFGRLLP